jgi:hypothetical protein
MVDIFTKYCAAALFKHKTYAGLIGPFKKCISDMKGKPEVIYSDNEGALLSKQFKDYFASENITHLTTNTHAGVVERLIRTLKDYIYKRVESDRLGRPWHNFVSMAVYYYNNTHKHAVTGLTPSDASKPANHFDVKVRLLANMKQKRLYPEIKVGDKVRYYKKKEKTNKKERFSVWSENAYEVEEIKEFQKQKMYKLKGTQNYNKPYFLRHELLLVRN